MNSAANIVKH